MLPMANRISNNCFRWQGDTINLPLHQHDKTFFLHGDGWINTWQRDSQKGNNQQIILHSSSKIDGVCDYSASLIYTLIENCLLLSLQIKNEGKHCFPFGAGFHPFFNLIENSKLAFDAQGMWLEDENYLPTDYLDEIPESFNFHQFRNIPKNWINSGYKLRNLCKVTLKHPNAIKVILNSPCHYLQVYKPEGNSSYICLEPQSHFVDAHNSPGLESLTILEAGQSMEIEMTILVSQQRNNFV